MKFLGFGSDDPSGLKPGTTGTIIYIDDFKTLHVSWDNGAKLGLVTQPMNPRDPHGFKPDRFEVIE